MSQEHVGKFFAGLTINRLGTTCSQDDRHGSVLVFERVEKEQRSSLLSLAGGPFHGEQIVNLFQTPIECAG